MSGLSIREQQGLIWDYFKPRHTHSWNMLVLSWNALNGETEASFKTEYMWENFIIRLWLYRTTVRALLKLDVVRAKASIALKEFDAAFQIDGKNGLKALRDMIEHFDEYAEGKGHGPGSRQRDLDPWRPISQDRYEHGLFILERKKSYDAAIKLHSDAKCVSDEFIRWYASSS